MNGSSGRPSHELMPARGEEAFPAAGESVARVFLVFIFILFLFEIWVRSPGGSGRDPAGLCPGPRGGGEVGLRDAEENKTAPQKN